jgi:hypothetical protein
MKKVLLSALAAITLGSVAANAVDLYEDANGQVFTSPAEGRTLIEDKSVSVFSHADKLKFSGLAYVGYRYNDFKEQDNESNFEVRRAYLQLKAYLMDDPKSYYRVTLDAHQDAATTDGNFQVRVKYAYIYLHDVLPFTGVELGLAHRPWHDYEEHTSWHYRNISKVLVEQGNGAHLSNSADFGFNFKTKTQYFDSEIGLYNGEGYHNVQLEKGLSLEWRATAHILGVNGKDKQTTKTYWDASFFGQYNKDHKDMTATTAGRYDDLVFGGLHTVYNQPSFLVAAQYIESLDTADNGSYVSAQAGAGYSFNGEYRFGGAKEYRVLGRYDSWTPEKENSADEFTQNTYIAGFAWQQNHNLQWVANVEITDNEDGSSHENKNGTAYMLTAQVEF